MRALYVLILAMLVVIALAVNASSRSDNPSAPHGAYLVNQVAMCGDCHTPMLRNGRPDQRRILGGAPLFFKPATRIPGWTPAAPNITSKGVIGNWSNAQLTRFLMTGISAGGTRARPPMPQYRMSSVDAKAVAIYLRSL